MIVRAFLGRPFDLVERVPTQQRENCFVYVTAVEEAWIVANTSIVR